MATLYFPTLTFNPGVNITVRMGEDWAILFGSGQFEAEIKQIGHNELFGMADIERAETVPFNMIQQEWIDEASYLGVHNLDDLYNVLAAVYRSQFDCETPVSVIYFTVRP